MSCLAGAFEAHRMSTARRRATAAGRVAIIIAIGVPEAVRFAIGPINHGDAVIRST